MERLGTYALAVGMHTLSVEFDQRGRALEILQEVIDAAPTDEDPLLVSQMHALRGQLAMAVLLESQDPSVINGISADFDRTMELDPSNPIIPTFQDSLDLVLAYRFGLVDELAAVEARIWDNVELCELGNLLSISSVALGLPISSGWPEQIASELADWDCAGADFCTENTWKAPYSRPGLAFHFAETFARVGEAEDARRYLDEALAAPGASEWPFRPFALATSDDFDGWVEEFAAIPDDQEATNMMYPGAEFGCIFCHAEEPPAHLIPHDRLTLVELDPDPDPDPDPAPDLVELGRYITSETNEAKPGDKASFKLQNHQGVDVVNESIGITTKNAEFTVWTAELARKVNDLHGKSVQIGFWHAEMNHYMYDEVNIFNNAVFAQDASYTFSTAIIRGDEPIPPTHYEYIYPKGIGDYVDGTKVLASDGNVYQCKPWPFTPWCNQSQRYYAPATGLAWSEAWNKL